MVTGLQCWRCGASLAALSLPLRRLEECPACEVQLHVCRMCVRYDPHIARQCREDDAEEVRGKEKANFCDYFRPNPAAFDASAAATSKRARGAADALFSGSGDAAPKPADPAAQAADALFGSRDQDPDPPF